jgi:hypothetical protein
MRELYEFDAGDRELLRAAAILLKKVAEAEATKLAQLVSIAKLQHVISVLPRATPDVTASMSVSSSPRNFGEIETFHWWMFSIGVYSARFRQVFGRWL